MIKYVHVCITQYAKKSGNETTQNWYSHIFYSVTEQEGARVFWNQGVKTDGGSGKQDRSCLLIDVAERNVIQNEAERKLKHEI
jgi:hypothetical protein